MSGLYPKRKGLPAILSPLLMFEGGGSRKIAWWSAIKADTLLFVQLNDLPWSQGACPRGNAGL